MPTSRELKHHRFIAYIIHQIGGLYVLEGFDRDPKETISAVVPSGDIEGIPDKDGYVLLVYEGLTLVEARALSAREYSTEIAARAPQGTKGT